MRQQQSSQAGRKANQREPFSEPVADVAVQSANDPMKVRARAGVRRPLPNCVYHYVTGHPGGGKFGRYPRGNPRLCIEYPQPADQGTLRDIQAIAGTQNSNVRQLGTCIRIKRYVRVNATWVWGMRSESVESSLAIARRLGHSCFAQSRDQDAHAPDALGQHHVTERCKRRQARRSRFLQSMPTRGGYLLRDAAWLRRHSALRARATKEGRTAMYEGWIARAPANGPVGSSTGVRESAKNKAARRARARYSAGTATPRHADPIARSRRGQAVGCCERQLTAIRLHSRFARSVPAGGCLVRMGDEISSDGQHAESVRVALGRPG